MRYFLKQWHTIDHDWRHLLRHIDSNAIACFYLFANLTFSTWNLFLSRQIVLTFTLCFLFHIGYTAISWSFDYQTFSSVKVLWLLAKRSKVHWTTIFIPMKVFSDLMISEFFLLSKALVEVNINLVEMPQSFIHLFSIFLLFFQLISRSVLLLVNFTFSVNCCFFLSVDVSFDQSSDESFFTSLEIASFWSSFMSSSCQLLLPNLSLLDLLSHRNDCHSLSFPFQLLSQWLILSKHQSNLLVAFSLRRVLSLLDFLLLLHFSSMILFLWIAQFLWMSVHLSFVVFSFLTISLLSSRRIFSFLLFWLL